MVSRSSFSRNWRSRRGLLVAMAELRRGSVGDHSADDRRQDGIGRLPIGMSVEVENDAVPEYGGGNGLDILRAQVVPAVHQGADAAALHQGLCAARRTPVANIFFG